MIATLADSFGPSLGWLATWSVRWAVLIALLAAWFRFKPPRRAATRHLLIALTLMGGLLLPIVPTWRLPDFGFAAAARRSEIPLPPTQDRDHILDPMLARSAPSPSPAVRLVERQSGKRSVVGIVTLTWLAGALGYFARGVIGHWGLFRLRWRAGPVEGPSRAVFDQVRGEVGLGSRPVVLASHPGVGSPVVLGGARAMVLVPDDWAAWPAAAQRACLLHELVHLVRHDGAWKLLAELVRVPFWFHPGVAWLQNRLDHEAELACDEATVAHGVHPRDLARLLLDFARRPFRLDPRALSFWTPTTVATRINRLLEDDMPRTTPPRSLARLVSLIVPVAALALAIGGARVGAIEPTPALPTVEVAQAPTPAPTPRDDPPQAPDQVAVNELAGLVVDQQGRPLAGVLVHPYSWVPYHQTLSDQAGRFRIKLPEQGKLEVRLTKEGYEPREFLAQPTGQPGWVVTMGNTTYFEGRVLAPDGSPVADASGSDSGSA